VPIVRLLPERMHRFAREAVAFSVAGLSSTAVDLTVFNALIFLGPLQANLISTVIGTILSFGMNRRWTYRDRVRTAVHRELALFFVVNLIGLGIQEIVLGLARYGLNLDASDDRFALNLFKLAGISAAMVFRFWAYRTLVFRRPPEDAPDVVPAVPGPHPIDEEFAELTWPLETRLSDSEPAVP
jgi:putative flippase GtrA